MQRTIKISLPVSESLKSTIELYNEIKQYIADIGYENKTYNQVKLHKLTYRKIRNKYPKFPSALIQTARNVASECLKRTKCKTIIKIKPYSSIRLDKRNLRVNLIQRTLSISSIDGRLKFDFRLNKHTEKFKNWSVKGAHLKLYKNRILLFLTVELETPQPIINTNTRLLGIDQGINNIIVCSNNQFFNSKHLRYIKGKYQYLRRKLQSKGTRSAKRKLKKISGKERRFVSDVLHRITKQLVSSDYNVFAIEDLKHIHKNKRKYRKSVNKKLGNWSYAKFIRYLEYKCEQVGKMVIRVNPAYTSQRCSKCGHQKKDNRHRSEFKCKKCGYETHADLNASKNIAKLGKSEVSRLLFNQPNVTIGTKL